MEIYLDNCSTTKPREEVIEEMIYYLSEEYGNPSSLHRLGFKIEKKIELVRNRIADYLNVSKDEIYFTSGGTESNNIAIQGIINGYSRLGKHIIITGIEHPSVLNIVKQYEEKGFDISYLKVNNKGIIDLDEFRNSIRKDTILVSIMHVNNEIGSIQPIKSIKKILRKEKSKALLHVDGVQGFGKIPIEIKNWEIDAYTFSGHKIYGPKGIGGLYLNKDIKIKPLVLGGEQERGLRSGTENIPGIMGFGKAVELIAENHEKDIKHIRELKSYFIDELEKKINYITINSPLGNEHSPYILNVSFKFVLGEILLHYLEDKGVYISTGSACSSKGVSASHVIIELGLSDNEIQGTVRFCFSHENTKEEIDRTIKITKNSVEEIRKITMR